MFEEYGSVPVEEQGKRNDLTDLRKWILTGRRTMRDCRDEYPGICARYEKFVNQCLFDSREDEYRLRLGSWQPNPGWQSNLTEKLVAPVNSRTISWYYESIGNVGKSYFANHWNNGSDTIIVTGGRHNDIFYLYANAGCPKYVFFDWSRAQEETFPYGVVENIKNGCITVSKYESRVVFFPTPYIVVFSNFPPDQSKLSLDRWDIVIIE